MCSVLIGRFNPTVYSGYFCALDFVILEHRRTVRLSSVVIIYVALFAVNYFVTLKMLSSDLGIVSVILMSIRVVLEMSLLMIETQNKS